MSEAEHASTNAAADQNRDDLVERLKAELASKTKGEAEANARMQIYEGKERARISAWQEDAKFFMNEFVNEEIDAHHPGLSKDDVAPLGNWAATYHEKADIASQGALAAVSYVASKGIKRLREQASQGAQAATTLAETMKANEELAAANAKLQKDCDDYKILCDERQKGLETLQAELVKGGLMSEKFNFSKLTSREEAPPAEPHAAVGRGGDALARGRQGRGLQGGGVPRRATRSSRRTCCRRCSPQQRWPAHDPERHQPRASGLPSAARPTSAQHPPRAGHVNVIAVVVVVFFVATSITTTTIHTRLAHAPPHAVLPTASGSTGPLVPSPCRFL